MILARSASDKMLLLRQLRYIRFVPSRPDSYANNRIRRPLLLRQLPYTSRPLTSYASAVYVPSRPGSATRMVNSYRRGLQQASPKLNVTINNMDVVYDAWPNVSQNGETAVIAHPKMIMCRDDTLFAVTTPITGTRRRMRRGSRAMTEPYNTWGPISRIKYLGKRASR